MLAVKHICVVFFKKKYGENEREKNLLIKNVITQIKTQQGVL